MLTIVINALADVIEAAAKQMKQMHRDIEAARLRAEKTRRMRKL